MTYWASSRAESRNQANCGGRLSTIDDNGLPRQKRRLAGQKHYGIGDLLRGGCPLNRQARRVDPNAGIPCITLGTAHANRFIDPVRIIDEDCCQRLCFISGFSGYLPDILLGYGPLPAAHPPYIGRNPKRYILVEEGAQ